MARTAIGRTVSFLFFFVHSCSADCNLGLGMITGDIRDSQITASSSHSEWTRPSAGRLWNLRRTQDDTFGGWCAVESDHAPYLQVDFRKETVITAVASQGLNFPFGNWVKKYSLNYSCDGFHWQTYQSYDKNWVLKANSDDDSVVTNKLDDAIIARMIRINVLEWNTYGMVCMRLEIYGCDITEDGSYKDCTKAAGLENRQISDSQLTASSFSTEHLPSQGRLNNILKQLNGSALWDSWCAGAEDSSQYLQVDLAEVKNVSGVATQGSVMGTWVTKYMLNYSSDGYQWETYSNHTDSGPQILQGNKDGLTVHKNMFAQSITARYIRFNPRGWVPLGHICMRVEIYLCRTYQGCPRLVEAPRTTTMPTSRNVFSDERNNQATSKTNEQIRTDSETPHIDFEWEAYSGGLRNTAGVIPWISLLIKLVSLYMMT